MIHPRLRAVFAGLAVLLALTACTTQDGVASQAGNTGYVSGDGTIEEFAAADRVAAPEFGGETVTGEQWDSSEFAGQVIVVNFWYAACGPCRVEAPVIHEAVTSVGDDVAFIGVNLRDTAPTAQAFEDTFDVPYPSILDEGSGSVQLAFAGTVVPNAVPTTLVIDSEGLIAARISGAITESSILTTIIEDQLAAA